ncbi:hypothetical protein [Rhizobium sp. BK176]|uniref:hypothetical protein n=1 Tax=Rhizobium sp. BK176 TaxID=2587071 RepID=UPI00216947BE|nr:hypothetical protein [Rhizobium sp. BK176]MCS4089422.1 hypothetical protein [Rhizobium sp. BK176]
MKVYIHSPKVVNEAVVALKNAIFDITGRKYPHHKAQELFASTLGFETFYSLKNPSTHIAVAELDDYLTQDQVSARRSFQAKAVASALDVDLTTATAIVEQAQPSGTRRRCLELLPSPFLDELTPLLISTMERSHRGMSVANRVRSHVLDVASLPLVGAMAVRLDESVDSFMSRPIPAPTEVHKERPNGDIISVTEKGVPVKGWDLLEAELSSKFIGLFDGLKPSRHAGDPTEGLWKRLAGQTGASNDQLVSDLTKRKAFKQIAQRVILDAKNIFANVSVRDALTRSDNGHGFVSWYPGIEESSSFEGEMWRPLEYGKGDVRRGSLSVRDTDVSIEITRERGGDDGEYALAFYFVTARAIRDGRTIGVLKGELIVNRQPSFLLDPHDAYFQAESKGGDITHLVHILLTDHRKSAPFQYHDLFYISNWEVAKDMRGTGFGQEFLISVVNDLKRRHRRLGSVAYESHPPQYPHPFPINMPEPLRDDYRRDMKRLSSYLRQTFISIFPGEVIEFEVTEEQEALDDDQRAALHVHRNRAARFGTPRWTKTNPAFRKPLTRFTYPAERTGFIWQTTRYLDPHPDLWNRLPRDLDAIVIDLFRSDFPGCFVQRLSFRFANRKVLSIEIEDFLDQNFVPVELRDTDEPNPFSEHFSCQDLMFALRAETGLLFSQRPNGTTDGVKTIELSRKFGLKREEGVPVTRTKSRRRATINQQYHGPATSRSMPPSALSIAPNRFVHLFTGRTLGPIFKKHAGPPPNTPHQNLLAEISRGDRRSLPSDISEIFAALDYSTAAHQANGAMVFDIEEMISESSPERIGSRIDLSRLPDFFEDEGSFFVSFGSRSFPSPREGIFVDGCYLTSPFYNNFDLFFTCTMPDELLEEGPSLVELASAMGQGFHLGIWGGTVSLDSLTKTLSGIAPVWREFATKPVLELMLALEKISQGEMNSVLSGGVTDIEPPLNNVDPDAARRRMYEATSIFFIRPA